MRNMINYSLLHDSELIFNSCLDHYKGKIMKLYALTRKMSVGVRTDDTENF